MRPEPQSASLHLYAKFVVLATFCLLFVGAMVTSKDAGMAVPDWPLSFGSVNPPGWWKVDAVFWEHSHRLAGMTIGILTMVLAVWIWQTYPGKWMRWLGPVALAGVILQGILGGMRVKMVSTPLALVHGCTAQAFFCLVIFIAFATAPVRKSSERPAPDLLRLLGLLTPICVFIQLILGATMRHLKAGLAIPDFPLAMGRIVPEFTHYGVVLHYAHRVWGVVVLLMVISFFVAACRDTGVARSLQQEITLLLFLVVFQILLGGAVIWHLKSPLPTSLHVVNGALILGTAFHLCLRLRYSAVMLDKTTDAPGWDKMGTEARA